MSLRLGEDERTIVDVVSSDIKDLPQDLPVDFIFDNRVCYILSRKIDSCLKNMQIKARATETESLIDEIYNLSKIFREKNIEYVMLCKTIESHCDHNEVDVLVRSDQLEKAQNIVEYLGYISVPWGGAYAKRVDETIIQVDIYSEKVYDFMFKGKMKKRVFDGIKVPSPEYEVCLRLIKIIYMHSKKISLCDLLHISRFIESYNVQDLPKNIRKSWIKPYLHSIYLINNIYKELYSRDIKAPIVERAKEVHKESRFWNLLSKAEIKEVRLPFRSLVFSYSCYVYKLLYELTHLNIKETRRDIKSLIYHITIPVSNNSVSIFSLRRFLTRRRLIICFTGMDGTGKTSHAIKIVKDFKKMGIPCKYIWCNWVPRVSYPVMVLIYLLTGYRRKEYHKSKIIKKIWNYLVVLDFLYIYLIKIKFQQLIGRNIICDRYIYDMIVDLKYDGLYNEKASKVLLKLIPEPDVIYMLDVPEGISNLRKDDTKDAINIKDTDNVIDYLSIHRKSYLEIAELLGIKVIDSTKDFDTLYEEIYKKSINTYNEYSRGERNKEYGGDSR